MCRRLLIAIAIGSVVLWVTQWGLIPAIEFLVPSTVGKQPFLASVAMNVVLAIATITPGVCAGWISGRHGILLGMLTGLIGSITYSFLFMYAGLHSLGALHKFSASAGLLWFWSAGPGLMLTCAAGGAAGELLRSNNSGDSHLFQNRGETRLSHAVKKRFVPPDYHLLNHVTLRLNDETTQIDHILVSRFGIFVIETKDYKGWIFAGPRDRYWTQVLFRARFKFQNPIHQNYKHACAIQELLAFLPADGILPVVVFTGNAEFKTSIPDGVFRLPEFLAYVDGHATQVMSVNRLQFCVGRLETARLAISKETDVEHIQRLRRRYGNDA